MKPQVSHMDDAKGEQIKVNKTSYPSGYSERYLEANLEWRLSLIIVCFRSTGWYNIEMS